ncbi:MAG: hypothetical protein ACI9OO_000333, partial [Bacteroidia bacterium]
MDNVPNGYINVSLAVIVFFILYELAKGATRNGKKNSKDWQMLGIAVTWLHLIERPLLILSSFGLFTLLVPEHVGAFAWLEDQYLLASIIGFVMIDELLHGWVHNFAHE